jgi:hypothetical protein
MSLWCSLLGHRFGETTVEREREEREEEVLTVSREVETCERCGDRRIVSENTEVTTVEPTPEDVEPTEEDTGLGGVVTRSGSEPGEGIDPPGDPSEEDAEILTGGSEERAPGEWPSEPGEPDDPTDEPTDDSAPDPAVVENADPDPGTFHCPGCGFTAEREGSALREGDACPECMEDYLEVR